MAASSFTDDGDLLRDGWLNMNTEEGGSLASWKKLFFRFTNKGLYWYKSDPTSVTNLLKEENLQPLGFILKENIVGASRVVTDKKFSFKVDIALTFEHVETSAASFYDKAGGKSP